MQREHPQLDPDGMARPARLPLRHTAGDDHVAEEAEDIAARFPRGRAAWDSVQHMYEIGRAPENASHPEHELARILGKGFWASLPYLDRAQLATILERGRTPANTAAVDAALQTLDTESFRARLGRIACGYDGGQIYREDDAG